MFTKHTKGLFVLCFFAVSLIFTLSVSASELPSMLFAEGDTCSDCADLEEDIEEKKQDIEDLQKLDAKSSVDYTQEINRAKGELVKLESEFEECCDDYESDSGSDSVSSDSGSSSDSICEKCEDKIQAVEDKKDEIAEKGETNDLKNELADLEENMEDCLDAFCPDYEETPTNNDSDDSSDTEDDSDSDSGEGDDESGEDESEVCDACASLKKSIDSAEDEIEQLEVYIDDPRVAFDPQAEINRLRGRITTLKGKLETCLERNCDNGTSNGEIIMDKPEPCDECEYLKDKVKELKEKLLNTDLTEEEIKEIREEIVEAIEDHHKCLSEYCPVKEELPKECKGCHQIHKEMVEIEKVIRKNKKEGKETDEELYERLKKLKARFRHCIENCREIEKDRCPDCNTILTEIKKYELLLEELKEEGLDENAEEIAKIDTVLQNLYLRYEHCLEKRENANGSCEDIKEKECPDCSKYKKDIEDIEAAIEEEKAKDDPSEEMIDELIMKLQYLYEAYKKCHNLRNPFEARDICEDKDPSYPETPHCPDCSGIKDEIKKLRDEFKKAKEDGDEDAAKKIWMKIQVKQAAFVKCMKHKGQLRSHGKCGGGDIVNDPETEKECPNCTKLERKLQILLDRRFMLLEKEEMDKANRIFEEIEDLKEKIEKCWEKWEEKNEAGECEDPTPEEDESTVGAALDVSGLSYNPFEGEEMADSFFDVFVDVDVDNSNADGIGFLKRRGVVEGYSDGNFKPKKAVNRAEFTKMIVVAAGIDPDASKYRECFPDVQNEWFARYICYALEQGWVKGYGDGKFHPERLINKAESLKILIEVFSLGDKLSEVLPDGIFEDVSAEEWYALYVAFAKNNNILETTDNDFMPGNDMTRGKMSELLYRLILLIQSGELVFD